jgi:AraC family transcriptional regulator, L-rhamnose operon transcriptional activator RhaR
VEDPGIEDMPLDTSRDQLYFNEGAFAYAGYHRHALVQPLHTHSFMEIAFVIGGAGVHQSLAGRQPLAVGDAILLRPGVWHGYYDCTDLELYNCCFSSELLRRELMWTREDPLLGYLLWTGPYLGQGYGMLTMHLAADTLAECHSHLTALASLWHQPASTHRGDIIGRLALLLSQLGRTVAGTETHLLAAAGPAHPAVGPAMQLLEADPAHRWTLPELADRLHLAPGYLVRVFKSGTGLPPMAYLARLRAETAATLLLHTDQPVTAIGRAVGWPDQNYFARRFKAHYGLSATTYRARFAGHAAQLEPKLNLWPGKLVSDDNLTHSR